MSCEQKKPLAGLRIAITAVDLEQAEHRGIATYSKALLKSLHNLGAEIWLLTQFKPSIEDVKGLPEATQQLIFASRLLDALSIGKANTKYSSRKWLEKGIRLPSLIKQKLNSTKALVDMTLRMNPHIKQLYYISIKSVSSNPLINVTRLAYLKYTSGLVSAAHLYRASTTRALLNRANAIQIELKGFDVLLTTCPLYLEATKPTIMIQSIHDLIPLEYPPHGENVQQFGLRLKHCLDAHKLYVSKTTAKKYELCFGSEGEQSARQSPQNNQIVLQPPSLDLSEIGTIRQQHIIIPEQIESCKTGMDTKASKGLRGACIQAFRYILFHSSIERRKNTDFLLLAYQCSGLQELGIHLCITGHIKEDSYSQQILRLAASIPTIHITGFINEATKTELFINALMTCSPSLGEGFGIPVLDAACLGVPTLASSCDSHQEIANLFDFDKYVHLLQLGHYGDWGEILNFKCKQQLNLLSNPKQEFDRRRARYTSYQAQISSQFEKSLCAAITNAVKS